MSYPRARIVNGRLMSEPSLDPPEDPPEVYDEGSPVEDYDDFDKPDDGDPEYDRDCDYWNRAI